MLLNQTYGFGNGQVLAEDGDGNSYDLSAFLDQEGDLVASFPHPGTGPVPADVRERALAILVVPHPRPVRVDYTVYDVNFDRVVTDVDLNLVIEAILEKPVPQGVKTDIDRSGDTNVFDLTQVVNELIRNP